MPNRQPNEMAHARPAGPDATAKKRNPSPVKRPPVLTDEDLSDDRRQIMAKIRRRGGDATAAAEDTSTFFDPSVYTETTYETGQSREGGAQGGAHHQHEGTESVASALESFMMKAPWARGGEGGTVGSMAGSLNSRPFSLHGDGRLHHGSPPPPRGSMARTRTLSRGSDYDENDESEGGGGVGGEDDQIGNAEAAVPERYLPDCVRRPGAGVRSVSRQSKNDPVRVGWAGRREWGVGTDDDAGSRSGIIKRGRGAQRGARWDYVC